MLFSKLRVKQKLENDFDIQEIQFGFNDCFSRIVFKNLLVYYLFC
jgi:hypothetical protein